MFSPCHKLGVISVAVAITACGADAERQFVSVDATIPELPFGNDGNSGDSVSPGDDAGDVDQPDGPDATDSSQEVVNVEGAALYDSLCASCHGGEGQGGVGPALWDWQDSEADLVAEIEETMPYGAPENCDLECSQKVAAYILEAFSPPAADCDPTTEFGPRRARLLTRREYERTISDLFQSELICLDNSDCESGTCQSGLCRDDCGETAFAYDAGGRTLTSVHVAGSFNDWPATLAGGGWPLTRDPAGVWRGDYEIPSGEHQYKFVLNESEWIVDPSNPNRASDGFGGENARVSVDCGTEANAFPENISRDFPAESKPSTFGYDTWAEGGIVTSVHVTEFLSASLNISDAVDLGPLMPCWDNFERCLTEFVDDFGGLAFRRPIESAEAARYVELGQTADDLDAAARLVIAAMLNSPNFLYRYEVGEPEGAAFQLTDYEVASALSYGFWGTMPDSWLFDAAAAGQLSTLEDIEAAARRMLADRRARETVRVFALQWLGAEPIFSANKKPELFPTFTDEIRAAMANETSRFVEHVTFDSTGKFDELYTANYTIADRDLAGFYGFSQNSEDFVVTPYPDATRSGVLGHGSVLATTAHSDQTSPIRRGLFVRGALLCQDLGVAPPNAGGVPDVDPNATTRERFRQHTDNPFCQSCHQYIDDVGFGFENFDPVGRFRTLDNGAPIDSAGDMNDIEGLGTSTRAPYSNLSELAALLAESEAAQNCYVRQYYRFIRGMNESASSCTVRQLQAQFDATDGSLIDLMVASVVNHEFLFRN